MKGWVYVISNKAMQGMVKVGYSTKDPELRAAELNHTGSPHPYVVEYEMLIEEPYQIEQQTHKFLSSKREAKEWFRCSAEEAVAAIKQVSGTRAIVETYKRAERAMAEALHQQELEEQETRRKREKAEKDVEDRLRNEEAIIREKFERQIAASFPPRPFWNYWLGGGILVAIALGIFVPKISVGAGFMLSVIGGGIAGFFLQEYFEKKRKRSNSYISLERQRDEELAAVRVRVVKGIIVQNDPVDYLPADIPEIRLAKLKKFKGDEVAIARCTQKVEKIIGGILTAADCRKVAIATKVKIIVNAPKQNVINMITNSYPGIIADTVATNIYIALTER